MSKFKVEDRVKYIGGMSLIFDIGKTYEVLEVSPILGIIRISSETLSSYKEVWCSCNNFELVTKDPFLLNLPPWTRITTSQQPQPYIISTSPLYGTGTMKIETDEKIHDCTNYLSHYIGFTESYKYCTKCDKKFRKH